MPKVNELTVRCENRPGTLSEIATVLGNVNVNILGFLLTTSGEGRLKLVVDRVEEAKTALEDAGFTYSEHFVLHARLPNVPGHWDALLANWQPKTSISSPATKRSRKIPRKPAWCWRFLISRRRFVPTEARRLTDWTTDLMSILLSVDLAPTRRF
jgi:hypothetical protein